MTAPARRARLAAALAIGLAAAALGAWLIDSRNGAGGDFTWAWRAARHLLAGRDPYPAMAAWSGGPYPYNFPMLYPLPAAVAALPVAWLPARWAAVVFVGASAALLAWALTRDGWGRLWCLVSLPYVTAAQYAQWSPVVCAAALLPGAAWLLACKPHLGLAAFVRHPTRRGAAIGLGFALATVALLPAWPAEWLATLRTYASARPPILTAVGALVTLPALLRWRQPEARLLLALACVPQSPYYYDRLLLCALVPRSGREALALALAGWVGMFGLAAAAHAGAPVAVTAWPTVTVVMYLPALLVVLRRPNAGAVPAWLERAVAARRSVGR